MGLLDSNIFKVRKQFYYEQISYNLATKGVIKDVTNPEQFCGMLIDITIPDGGEVLVIGKAKNASNNANMPIYDIYGNIVKSIKKSGIYYVDSYVRTIELYNNVAVSGTASIGLYATENPPLFASSIKPIQRLRSTATTVSGSTRTLLASKVPVKDFKFFFVSLFIRDSSGKAKNSNFIVQAQPYISYDGISASQSGVLEDVDELTSAYTYQSKWQQVRSDDLSIYIKPTSFEEGTTVYCSLYGVR